MFVTIKVLCGNFFLYYALHTRSQGGSRGSYEPPFEN